MINFNITKGTGLAGVGLAVSGVAWKIIAIKTSSIALAAILPYGFIILGVSLAAVGLWGIFKNRNITVIAPEKNDNKSVSKESKDFRLPVAPNPKPETILTAQRSFQRVLPTSPIGEQVAKEASQPKALLVNEGYASDNENDVWYDASEKPSLEQKQEAISTATGSAREQATEGSQPSVRSLQKSWKEIRAEMRAQKEKRLAEAAKKNELEIAKAAAARKQWIKEREERNRASTANSPSSCKVNRSLVPGQVNQETQKFRESEIAAREVYGDVSDDDQGKTNGSLIDYRN